MAPRGQYSWGTINICKQELVIEPGKVEHQKAIFKSSKHLLIEKTDSVKVHNSISHLAEHFWFSMLKHKFQRLPGWPFTWSPRGSCTQNGNQTPEYETVPSWRFTPPTTDSDGMPGRYLATSFCSTSLVRTKNRVALAVRTAIKQGSPMG